MKTKHYGIVGSGRLATHIKRYFDLLEIRYSTWSRKTGDNPPEATLSQCDTILILISDSAIEPFVKNNVWLAGKTVVHMSGGLSIPGINSVHPLMTFTQELRALEFYREISFVLENRGERFEILFPELSNRHFYIDSAMKPFYHALCVMSGNFTSILWAKFFNALEKKLGIPKEAALPYMTAVFENLSANHETALTGPFSRNDRTTIEKNLSSLANDNFKPVYESFAGLFKEKTLQ